MNSNPLEQYGWGPRWDETRAALAHDAGAAPPDLEPARVVEERRDRYRVISRHGELAAQVSGRFRHTSPDRESWPAVGDWVMAAVRPGEGSATIHQVLNRHTALVRRDPDPATAPQVLAANLDAVFLVTSLNRDFNPRRIERTLALIWESGAEPVIVLSKAALCDDPSEYERAAAERAIGVPVVTVSALEGIGLAGLDPWLEAGRTLALIGSSGAGKSTLVNALAGEELLETAAIREDDARGRHTTSHRQLLRLPGGALVIDTPGLRQIQLWDGEESLGDIFPEIEELAAGCRFRDCRHDGEPGCAIQEALGRGELDPDRLRSWRKLQRELAFIDRRKDKRAEIEESRRWRSISRWARAHTKARERERYG